MQTIKLRQDFLNYFRKNGHKYLPPSKVYNDDPSLFFVNSGMCQLKDTFLGLIEPKKDFQRLMNSQICVRAGGKHNDLDDVGKDSYHLTCFEMCGNWSLNDYGKEEAIKLALNFLINVCKLNKDQMYVTYFEGNGELKPDLETVEIWKKYIDENRIIPGNFKDNFWMIEEFGLCGNSTEIHYDLIGNRYVPNLVNKDDPNVIEIWNIVFMQYNKNTDGFHKLDKFYVDTGLGLERVAMIIQNKQSLYQTDSFKYLFGYAQALTDADFYEDEYDSDKDRAYRIFVDHIRTSIICLHQGVDFDCNKRGFILRKIFRRLLTNLYLYLNNKIIEPKMNKPIILCLITQILDFFLEFKHDAQVIQNKLIEEEKLYLGKLKNVNRKYNNFLKKLNREEVIDKLKKESGIDYLIIENLNDLKFNY